MQTHKEIYLYETCSIKYTHAFTFTIIYIPYTVYHTIDIRGSDRQMTKWGVNPGRERERSLSRQIDAGNIDLQTNEWMIGGMLTNLLPCDYVSELLFIIIMYCMNICNNQWTCMVQASLLSCLELLPSIAHTVDVCGARSLEFGPLVGWPCTSQLPAVLMSNWMWSDPFICYAHLCAILVQLMYTSYQPRLQTSSIQLASLPDALLGFEGTSVRVLLSVYVSIQNWGYLRILA